MKTAGNGNNENVRSFLKANQHLLVQSKNGDTRTTREIYSEVIIKTPNDVIRSRSDVFIINFEQVSRIVLVLPFLPGGSCQSNATLITSTR